LFGEDKMIVKVALRNGTVLIRTLAIKLEVEKGVPQYPDTIVDKHTYAVYLRKTTPCQGKACYDLVKSLVVEI
jgi:hypothetical protein